MDQTQWGSTEGVTILDGTGPAPFNGIGQATRSATAEGSVAVYADRRVRFFIPDSVTSAFQRYHEVQTYANFPIDIKRTALGQWELHKVLPGREGPTIRPSSLHRLQLEGHPRLSAGLRDFSARTATFVHSDGIILVELADAYAFESTTPNDLAPKQVHTTPEDRGHDKHKVDFSQAPAEIAADLRRYMDGPSLATLAILLRATTSEAKGDRIRRVLSEVRDIERLDGLILGHDDDGTNDPCFAPAVVPVTYRLPKRGK